MRKLAALVAAAFCLSAAPGAAQSAGSLADAFGIQEIRGGAAVSSLELIPMSGIVPDLSSFCLCNLDSFQFDVLWHSPDMDVFRWIGAPRPAIGGVINLRGRENLVHAGLNWQAPLGDTFYAEAGVGLGIHDGALQGAVRPLRNMGCRVLYHWSLGVGANITDNMTITANWQHLSNIIAGCTPNDGLNNFGVSLGWKF